MGRRNADLTEGAIGGALIRFALPLLIGSLAQQLYNTVDLIFVGNFIGKSASAAIGASSLLITCFIGFFGGMSVGSGVVVSQIFGLKDTDRLSRAVHNTIALCIVGGLIFMIAGYIFSPAFLKVINTPASIQQSAVGYLQIYFFSFMSIFVYNLGSGVLRALGDSSSPMFAQLVGGLTNVVADYFFVRVFANGINGVAYATLISQTVAAVYILVKLRKLDEAYRLNVKKIAFDGEILKEVIRIGVPAGLQSLVITLSNVFVQYFINSLGEDAIAAFTAYFKVELLIYHPIVALGQACMTFSGQNKGAGNMERIREGTKQCTLISISIAVVTAVVAIPCGGMLFRIFNKEASVIALGRQIIGVTFPFYGLYSILQILGDSMRGVGKSQGPMNIILLNICIIRTALLFLVAPQFNDIRSVAAVYPITWGLTAVCMVIYYSHYHRNYEKGRKYGKERCKISE